MSSRLYGRSGLEPKSPPPNSSIRKLWIATGVLVLLLLTGGGAYYSIAAMRSNAEVARLEEKGQELFQLPQAGEAPPTPEMMEERQEKIEEFREEVEQLDESQQDQLREGFGRMMRAYIRAEVERFYSLPPEEQFAFLDEKIDQMEAMRQWGERQAQEAGEESGGRPGPPGGPPGGGAPGGGSPPDGGPRGGGRGQWAELSDEERQERFQQFRRQFISDTTPEERARMSNFWERMNERREERGLERMPDFGER